MNIGVHHGFYLNFRYTKQSFNFLFDNFNFFLKIHCNSTTIPLKVLELLYYCNGFWGKKKLKLSNKKLKLCFVYLKCFYKNGQGRVMESQWICPYQVGRFGPMLTHILRVIHMGCWHSEDIKIVHPNIQLSWDAGQPLCSALTLLNAFLTWNQICDT